VKGRRVLGFLLLTFFLIFMLSGCYDSVEVDDLAYVIAIGVDKGTVDMVKVTLQFALPLAMGTGGEGGGGGGGGGESEENKTVYNLTIDAPSILTGISMANNIVSKQINLSHTKIIVFSEEMAREGIGNYIVRLSSMRQLRPNTAVYVTRSSAEEFLKAVTPQLSTNTAKYYEQGVLVHERVGATANTQLHSFSAASRSLGAQPVVTLAGINRYETSADFKIPKDDASMGEDNNINHLEYKAGEIPRAAKNKAEVRGLAVFRGGKMIGELSGLETIFYMMVTGELRYNNITLQDPHDSNNYVVLNVKKSRNPVHSVEIVDGKPLIGVKILLEADISAIGSEMDYQEPEKASILEKECEKYIKREIESLLYKTSKEFNTDIFGFGNKIAGKFATWEEWEKFGWLQKYKDTSFSVEVDLVIRRPGLTVKSIPIISSEGAEGK